MKRIITKSDSSKPVGETAVYLFDDWFDPIEAGVARSVRGFIQAMIEGKLDETLMRSRYGRLASSSGKNDGLAAVAGHRHGHRSLIVLPPLAEHDFINQLQLVRPVR